MRVVAVLREQGSRTTGQLFTELGPTGITRDDLEEVIAALARAGVVRIQESVFEKDGRTIPYRKASLAREMEAEEWPGLNLQIKVAIVSERERKRKKKGAAKTKRAARATVKAKPAVKAPAKSAPADAGIETALRAWRLAEARRRGVPAFRILTDNALRQIADARPATASELLAISGIGMSTVEKYGAQIYRLLHGG